MGRIAHRHSTFPSSGFVGTSVARIDLGRPSSLMHLPVAPYVTSTFPPFLLLLALRSVYGHPFPLPSRGLKNVWKVKAAIEIFRRPILTLELERCQNFFLESVCFVLIIISYPQQLHSSITETTTHGTSTI